MARNVIEKRISYYTEWIKLLWLAFIGLTGGTIGLIFPPRTIIRDMAIVIGFVLILAVFIIIMAIHNRVENLIDALGGQ